MGELGIIRLKKHRVLAPLEMARDYIARDPKTGRPINRRRAAKQVDIRSMLPPSGVWERIPRRDIVPLASGQVKMVEILVRRRGIGKAY